MCGIAGVIDLDHNPVEPRLLFSMTNSIAHRGPDDEGYVWIDPGSGTATYFSGPASPAQVQSKYPRIPTTPFSEGASIALGHRRFSILDLSERGHQPFFDEEAGCCVVFNGEIYNYLELRKELTREGVKFHTDCDTEVLLKAYSRWGRHCYAKLNGFWSFALFDFRSRQLILSRDRLGKRPLYWTREGSRIYFASEIKALLSVPEVRRRRAPNRNAIETWLEDGLKDLNFSTCFAGVYSLASASWAVVDHDFPAHSRYFWAVPQKRLGEHDISIPEAARELRTLLEDAVSIRLRAHVPLSVELSGGLDSSVLVALASQERKQSLTTYTVRFPDPTYNEEPYARSVAERFKTDYWVLESPISNFWSQIKAFTYLEEEPYHSPNLQTNQAIWAQMRAMGTKVSLNGAGGDEDFAGYSAYFTPAQKENLATGNWMAYLRNGTRYSQGRTNILGLIRPIIHLARRRHGLSQKLYSDMTNTLMPYWLRSGDRGYMGIPLEVRAPLLDYRVVDFAFQLPITYLIRDGWHKWILRIAMRDLLPHDVLWRKQKMGFPFPFELFYKEAAPILDIIARGSSNPFLDAQASPRWRSDWKAISFLLWYEMFFNSNEEMFHSIEAKSRELHSAENYGFEPEFLSSTGFAV